MIRALKVLLLLAVAILLWASCQYIPTKVNPDDAEHWSSSWLTHPVCQLPCWLQITPGVTTLNDAISILERAPKINITAKSEYGVDWQFSQNKDEGGTLSISQDGIVRAIWLESVSEEKLLLKTVIASYGDPDYVKPFDCRESMCSTALIYPDLGMFLTTFTQNLGGSTGSPQVMISPDVIVNRVYFVEPGKESFLSLFGYGEREFLMDWHGYGDYFDK